jgi:excisionase family DNA binding protein
MVILAEFFTVEEIACNLCLTQARIYQLIATGEIPVTRIGNRIRIPRAAWNQWLADKSAEALASVKTGAAQDGEKGGTL